MDPMSCGSFPPFTIGLILTGGCGAFSEPNENPHVSRSWASAELETLLLERMFQGGGGVTGLLFPPSRPTLSGGFSQTGEPVRPGKTARNLTESIIDFKKHGQDSSEHRRHATCAQCSRVYPSGGGFTHLPPGICNLFDVGHGSHVPFSDRPAADLWTWGGAHNDVFGGGRQDFCGRVRV
jgi:hypothetical protein